MESSQPIKTQSPVSRSNAPMAGGTQTTIGNHKLRVTEFLEPYPNEIVHVIVMQDELPLFQANKEDPNVQDFVALIARADGWLTASDVLFRLLMLNTDSNRRLVRAWAEASDGEIISGQKGYLHVKHATPEEINHAANWLVSQGKKMIKRGIKIRRQAHAAVG